MTRVQPSSAEGETSLVSRFDRAERLLRIVALGSGGAGLVLWFVGGLYPSVFALWAFVVCSVAVCLLLPLEAALVAPLFFGVVGWLVDMLPLLILTGWTTVVLRWLWSLWRERRVPLSGRWVWLPVGLLLWTGIGVVPIALSGFEDFKHFLLLTGIQFVVTGVLLMVPDKLSGIEAKAKVVSGLALFVTLCSAAVLLQWMGIPVESLQDPTARRTVESAYGLDAFPNSVGMIKYARSVNAGAQDVRDALDGLAPELEGLPPYEVFRPRLQAYENSLVIRFAGSARAHEAELGRLDIDLVFDNVGLAPANTVPRLRSFPRNALTYAGVCAALFPLMLWLAWSFESRRRLLGRIGAASCLFGSAFSLARGSWIAIAIGVIYLAVDGALSRRRKVEVVAWYLAAAIVLGGVFMVFYGVDPVTGRAGGGASVNTRQDLYGDTLSALKDYHLVTGYGTERPRLETGGTRAGQSGGEYVPRAGTHSTFLNYLFRTGVPGMLLIAGIYAFAILSARAAARSLAGADRSFFTLATAAVVSAAAHGVILSLYVEPTYTLSVTILLGLAIAGALGLERPLMPWKRSPEPAQ